MHGDTRRKPTHARHAREVIRAMPARTATIASTARKKVGRAGFASDKRWQATRAAEPSLMENPNAGDGVNFFAGRAPDVFAIGVRVRRIGCVNQIVTEPAGDHHALV